MRLSQHCLTPKSWPRCSPCPTNSVQRCTTPMSRGSDIRRSPTSWVPRTEPCSHGLRVDDNTSAECLSTRLTQGLAEGRECAIRLDARRLSDEVAQCFNLAKIKKAL